MITDKNLSVGRVLAFSGHHWLWLLTGSFAIASFYKFGHLEFSLPWLPVSVIGTAVAFYVGFKNNSAYDRLWEARKIWGAIINSSRAWGMYVDGFITNQFNENPVPEEAIKKVKKRLIYRHIAWLYALRSQLLIPAPWEHINQGFFIRKVAERYREQFGVGLIADQITQTELHNFLPADEYERMINHVNTATQIINEQSRDLTQLREQNLIEDFRHMEMMQTLYHFFDHQGKCERIKKFPLPRQYANTSFYFVAIFIILLPFSMIPEMMKLGEWGFWLSIPITALIGWVYVMMEVVGDYSENPFQGMANDIPMLSLCRVIEIDLKEMLGEKDLPPPVQAKKGVLM
jgi:putative membrane protein